MKEVHIKSFGLENNTRYHKIGRYSLVHFDLDMNLAIATPQHTPLVDCFELIYDTSIQ